MKRMKFDEVAMKMAYEAAREQFLRIYSEVPNQQLPQELSSHLCEAYRRGYERAYRNATEFEPVPACRPPAELDGGFAQAWEKGYAYGTSRGEMHAQTLVAEIGRQIKSTLL
jgi:hypothetical protein